MFNLEFPFVIIVIIIGVVVMESVRLAGKDSTIWVGTFEEGSEETGRSDPIAPEVGIPLMEGDVSEDGIGSFEVTRGFSPFI